jgi:hypothetical protein
MVLVDTSVWVSHLRDGNAELSVLLNNGEVLSHPFIVGELACGNLKDRVVIISYLEFLPMSQTARHEEVMAFIEGHRLMGKGLGYVDLHLLVSAVLTDVPLWTLDRRLAQAAGSLHFRYQASK